MAPERLSSLAQVLIRLPREHREQLRELARRTRVRQSDYLREAVADLLAKHRKPCERKGAA